MGLFRHSNELLPERRVNTGEHGARVVRRGRRFSRITRQKFWCWVFLLATLFLLYILVFGLKVLFHGKIRELFIYFCNFVYKTVICLIYIVGFHFLCNL